MERNDFDNEHEYALHELQEPASDFDSDAGFRMKQCVRATAQVI